MSVSLIKAQPIRTISADDMTDADWARVLGFDSVDDLYAAEAEGAFDDPEPFVCPNGYNDAACDAFCEPGHPYAA